MDDSTDEYSLATCIQKLENLKLNPQKCPFPKCSGAFVLAHTLSHFLAEHYNLKPIRIDTARPKEFTILPQKWPLNEVQVLALLCYEGRNGHESCTPAATKLCKPNRLLPAAHNELVPVLPMLLKGCRTTTTILCREELLVEPYRKMDMFVFWIQTSGKSRPLFGKLTLGREGTLASSSSEFEVQDFDQEDYTILKDMVIKTSRYLRVFEGLLKSICDGKEVPVKLEVTIKDYADPWFEHVQPDVFTNPYEAAIDNFKKMVLEEIIQKREEEEEKNKGENLMNLNADEDVD